MRKASHERRHDGDGGGGNLWECLVAWGKFEMESCSDCKFFRRIRPMQPIGKCHRNPPVTFIVGQTQDTLGRKNTLADSFWPMVPDTDFCGEWKPAPRSAALDIDLTKLDVEQLEGNA